MALPLSAAAAGNYDVRSYGATGDGQTLDTAAINKAIEAAAAAGGGTREQGARVMPEFEQEYPEPSRFGTVPAWGLWARHVRNLSLDHVEFRAAKDDFRPVAILADVADADIDHAVFPCAGDAAHLVLKDVKGFTLRNSRGLADRQSDAPIADDRL
jgi:hypothetical protein